jgi:hypothetical protein
MPIETQTTYTADCDLCHLAFTDDYGRYVTHRRIDLVIVLKNCDWFISPHNGIVVCWRCRHGNLMPKACQEPGSVWWHGTISALTCPHRDSAGIQCEVLGVHEYHKVGEHTIRHRKIGNGVECQGI